MKLMKNIIIVLMIGAMLAGLASCGPRTILFGKGSPADEKLFFAMQGNGNVEAAKEAIEAGANIDRFGGSLGDTTDHNRREKNPFRLACFAGKTHIAKVLLEEGADPNIIDVYGWPIMAYVVQMRDTDLCMLMLEKGADINKEGEKGKTPLNACFIQSVNCSGGDKRDIDTEKMYDFLVQNGAEVTPDTLTHAIVGVYGDGYTHYSLVRKIAAQLEQAGQSVNIDPLLKSIILVDESAAKQILRTGKKFDKRCLFFAAAFSTPEIFEALLREGRDLTERDLINESIFEVAAKCGNIGMLEYLIPKFDIHGKAGYDALKAAVMNNQVEAVRMLIDNNVLVVSPVQKDLYIDYEVLFPYACANGNTEMAYMLIENGITVIEDEYPAAIIYGEYSTAINSASRYDQIPIIELLIEMGSNVNKNEAGYDPLNIAAFYGNIEAVKLLVENGANINGNVYIPLGEACRGRNLEIAEFLIQQGADVNISWSGGTGGLPLYYAVMGGEFELVKLLVENGATIPDELVSWADPESEYGIGMSDRIYQYLLSERQKADNAR